MAIMADNVCDLSNKQIKRTTKKVVKCTNETCGKIIHEICLDQTIKDSESICGVINSESRELCVKCMTGVLSIENEHSNNQASNNMFNLENSTNLDNLDGVEILRILVNDQRDIKRILLSLVMFIRESLNIKEKFKFLKEEKTELKMEMKNLHERLTKIEKRNSNTVQHVVQVPESFNNSTSETSNFPLETQKNEDKAEEKQVEQITDLTTEAQSSLKISKHQNKIEIVQLNKSPSYSKVLVEKLTNDGQINEEIDSEVANENKNKAQQNQVYMPFNETDNNRDEDGRVERGTTVNQVEQYIKSRLPEEDVECEQLDNKGQYSSFKIGLRFGLMK
ncbi:hypothetical protein O3M35_012460 [Rhynocoris fuscipes]|uniref:Uncharacterized protein n=1 Tax=Rhynocoris fuscipes TaxID=488301 RepID=A0AAW1CZR3_9HEMI